MTSYKVYFVFECSPDTHWGEPNEKQINIEGVESYIDGEDCFDSEGNNSQIKNWESAVDDITFRWESDSLDEFRYIDHEKTNPFNNGKSEFEDGTGDVNFETIKVEIFEDDNWEKLIETKNL